MAPVRPTHLLVTAFRYSLTLVTIRFRRGLASSIIAEYQEKMKKNGDGRPIWLEASTERARNVYLRRGFRVAEVMHFGVGTHAADGTFKEGGEGVQSTAMYWSPSWEQKAIQ